MCFQILNLNSTAVQSKSDSFTDIVKDVMKDLSKECK